MHENAFKTKSKSVGKNKNYKFDYIIFKTNGNKIIIIWEAVRRYLQPRSTYITKS